METSKRSKNVPVSPIPFPIDPNSVLSCPHISFSIGRENFSPAVLSFVSYRRYHRRVLFLLRLVSFLFSLFFQSTRTLPGKTQTRSIGKPFFSHDLYPTLRVTAWCCISVTLFFALIWRYISPFTSHVECNTEPSDIQVTCRIFPAFFAIFTLASFILMRSLCQCTGTENKTKGECIVIYTRIPHPFCHNYARFFFYIRTYCKYILQRFKIILINNFSYSFHLVSQSRLRIELDPIPGHNRTILQTNEIKPTLRNANDSTPIKMIKNDLIKKRKHGWVCVGESSRALIHGWSS